MLLGFMTARRHLMYNWLTRWRFYQQTPSRVSLILNDLSPGKWQHGGGGGAVVVEEDEEEVEQAAAWFSFLLIPGPAMPRCVPSLGTQVMWPVFFH